MTRLSVNINKIATLRNARGGDNPNVVQVAKDCERFGAQGITIHPRPDERHITTKDVYDLKKVVTTEYNIEGYPDDRFMKLLDDVHPEQATLVPDPPNVLTSNAGWDTVKNFDLLKDICQEIKAMGIRVSIFIEPDIKLIEKAAELGTDRIELYTEPYASEYATNKEQAVKAFAEASKIASKLGLGINAGHDLSLENIAYLKEQLPKLDEVSIGHALISDALYYGLENTIQLYLRQLREKTK
ncbi:pyridoxine 5'-phosphate synthase [Marivirga atlantica]|uniref:Pyridoxine 5'-phosphate synthase n=1 Tax=Marivirga atlantica TaxID=1548457 RepID=A0A937A7W4_9BACT|nr:pyridoxine 5'-phosphate synthase [Marivirga atlantica]MBL0763815.1 pyridoxine 5'-phosphate synthase [Marivirga atlantica]